MGIIISARRLSTLEGTTLIGLFGLLAISLTNLAHFRPISGPPKNISTRLALTSSTQVQPIHTSVQSLQKTKRHIQQVYSKSSLSFEANQGQTYGEVKFLSRGSGYTMFLTSSEVVLTLQKSERKIEEDGRRTRGRTGWREETHSKLNNHNLQPPTILRMKLVGGNPDPLMAGLDELPAKSNYFIGSDPTKWQTNIPTYGKVIYHDVYPGVDLVYYGNQRQLEYDLIVAPGVDPKSIRLAFEGADEIEIDAKGDLILHTAGGQVIQRNPLIYQKDGVVRRQISGGYVLKDNHQVSFQVAQYDSNKPLVIDPMLSYSTYLGGNGDDQGFGIAVDASGNIYVAGQTNSPNFPTANPSQPVFGGGPADAFVTKLNADGTLAYSTYLGGSSLDGGTGIAVDALGNAYVTGYTTSPNFPTANPLQPAFGGGPDAFIVKLNTVGTVTYSTYLGGSGDDYGTGIAVDASGDIYLSGITSSPDFPTANPFQSSYGGTTDAFVVKLNATGTALMYSTYLGGSDDDAASGIAVDAFGNAYVTGETRSPNFPTANPLQPSFGGGPFDAFVTKIDPSQAGAASLVYSTYLGGSGDDRGTKIAVDGAGDVYVTGDTNSPNFPTVNPFQPAFGGVFFHAFVAKIDPSQAGAASLVYSTYLGGSDQDVGYGIAVDGIGNAYVTGETSSPNFPTVNPLQPSLGGGTDAFVVKLNTTGNALIYSSYLGGSGVDVGRGIAVDTSANIYVTGYTSSPNFPTANPVQPAFGGSSFDAFIAKIELGDPVLNVTPSSLNFGGVAVGNIKDLDFTVQNTGGGTLTGSATTGAPFSIVGDNSFSLAANQSKVITVRFSPTTASTFTGNVSITSNAGNGSVTLTGIAAVGPGPVVTNLKRPNWPTGVTGTAGDEVVIAGKNFGRNPGSVRFGSTEARIIDWSNTRIKLQVLFRPDNRKIALSFPLANFNSKNAPIVSVFDHFMNGNSAFYKPNDGTVWAFSGEKGTNSNACPTDSEAYAKNGGGPFTLNGEAYYVGTASCGNLYLQYDDHTGYDYSPNPGRAELNRGIAILSAAGGTVKIPKKGTDSVYRNPERFNALAVVHPNGFETWYLHARTHLKNEGDSVGAGEAIAEIGCEGLAGCNEKKGKGPYHLHFEVRRIEEVQVTVTTAAGFSSNGLSFKYSTPVDPYGWKGTSGDPYDKAINDPLW